MQYDSGTWEVDRRTAWKNSLLKHILIQFSCNDFLNANIKQLQNHEIKQWKTDLQTAHNRESPEGWRTGPHYMYLSCQSHLQEVSPMHTEQFVKIHVVLGILYAGCWPRCLIYTFLSLLAAQPPILVLCCLVVFLEMKCKWRLHLRHRNI